MNITFRKQLVFISLVSIFVLIFSGCLGDQPESVLDKELKFAESGEYEKLLDLYVKPDTLAPYTSEEKAMILQSIKMMGKISVQDFKIIKKEKISDQKYLITTYAKYIWAGKTKEETETRTVVKVNGEWKIAEKLPGFDTIFGIIALIGSVYIMKKRKIK